MNTYKIILIIGLLAFTTSSCIKDKFEEEIQNTPKLTQSSLEDNSFLNMMINEHFHFENSHVKSIEFTDNDNNGGVLTIHGIDKNENSQLFGSYTVKNNTSINLEIPGHIVSLTGILHRTDGTMSSTTIKLDETNTLSFKKKAIPSLRLNTTASTCQAGDFTVTQTGGTITIPNNQTYVIPEGHTFSGNVRFNKNGLLRVCGTATVSNIYENYSQSNIIVTSTGVWTSTNQLKLEEANSDFTNYGTVTASSFQAQGEFYNYGTTTISGDFTLDLKAKIYNHSTITMGGNCNVNQGGDLYNYCTMNVGGSSTNNGVLYNYGGFFVTGTIHFKYGANHNVGSGSFTTAGATEIRGIVKGPISGDYARINIEGRTRIYYGAKVKYNTDFCDANGIEYNIGSLDASVVSCVATISGTPGCFEGTEGSAPAEDVVTYYPGEDVFGSYVYEDLWPSYGDFDFNDLVIDHNYQFTMNSSNQITSITAKFKIRAVSSYNNGFAIQLPVSSSAVTSVEGTEIVGGIVTLDGNGVESGQSNAVVVIYDKINDYVGTSYVNIIPGGHSRDIPMTTVVISFDTPIDQFNASDISPFIYVNEVRNHEVHSSDRTAGTDKMNSQLYGSFDSKSSQQPFKSPTNLPFSFTVPISFDYPSERELITDTYLNFATWAQSSGSSNTDWYTSDAGNRNSAKIYD